MPLGLLLLLRNPDTFSDQLEWYRTVFSGKVSGPPSESDYPVAHATGS